MEYFNKSDELIYSMALRYDHGFGFYEKNKQDLILEKMNKLYSLYLEHKTDDEISSELSLPVVSVKQIREEVNGTGFYQENEQSKKFYNSFRKKM